MADFPVTSLCSFRNFRRDERKILGCARYSLFFIDTAMLIQFLSATGAFLEAKHIFENAPKDQLRFFMSLSLGTMYALTFVGFFMTYCCVKEAVTLIRVRLAVLLSSGLVNFLFLITVSTLMIYLRGKDHFMKELTFDPNDKSDIAWITVLVLSATSVLVSLFGGISALCFFQNFEKVSSMLNPYSTYMDATPESPYFTYWKPSRRFPTYGDIPRSPVSELYPHRALITTPSPKRRPPGHQAFMKELKKTLPHLNEPKRTVL